MAHHAPPLSSSVTWLRRLFRRSQVPLGILAVLVGFAAGLASVVQGGMARLMQRLIYGIGPEERLSSLDHIGWVRLLALPIGGLAVVGVARLLRRGPRGLKRAPIDVVEANALHGGDIPMRDSLLVSAQTILSNGCGASVGLEAAYAQIGGGIASLSGQWLRLRRAQQRQIVGAGAGAAVGAAFGAPLTGAFYAFEVVIGAYTPAAIGPVALACLVASLTVRAIGAPGYSISLPTAGGLETASYVLFAALGILCGVIGVAVMRLVTLVEAQVRTSRIPEMWRPFAGGLCMIPLALITPQALSAGHGALHLDMSVPPSLWMLLTIFAVKVAASAVSLGFGFRGGMFFASLFLGSLAGQIFMALLAMLPGTPPMDANDAAMVGMAGMAVAIVGAPLTMAMLVLESTHDFTLAAAALVASVSAATIVRETFGFSFSTWRMHTRGETIRSARDVSWIRRLTAGSLMRRGVITAPVSMPMAEARRRFPLGASTHVVLADDEGGFVGLVPVHTIHSADDIEAQLGTLAQSDEAAVAPDTPLDQVLRSFDSAGSDVLVVVDRDHGVMLGMVSESDVRRRYAAEMERAQRELFGE